MDKNERLLFRPRSHGHTDPESPCRCCHPWTEVRGPREEMGPEKGPHSPSGSYKEGTFRSPLLGQTSPVPRQMQRPVRAS